MKVASLSGSSRESVGKKNARQLRANGLVPCVLYGQGNQIHFSAKDIDLDKLVYTPYVFKVELDIDGQKSFAIIQDLQQDPLTGKVRHIDFLKLDETKPVKIGLPIKLTGNARGVLAGGKLSTPFRRLTVVALPDALPDFVEIDITKLRIGQSIRVGQINIEGLKFLDPQTAVVVAVRMARGAVKGSDADPEEDEE
ncbi:MAG: 50S ribosomal protein L25 [Flavobacteriia bacterium]|nr:50S ribosomal protein L25 [Flavobacteriia bacterium]OJX37435.1 MAG: 50S ribosomal protein L25/general stress protein Ctc [Flavobacteriia bacterium 40-80]